MFSLFQKKLGIDLGTSNTLIYLANKGVLLNEPSIVAFNNRTQRIVAVGKEARRMLNRTPSHISAIFPLINGVVSEFEMAEDMVRHFLRMSKIRTFNTIVVASIPTNLTEVESKSIEDVLKKAGASKVFLVPQPIAAALGSRLDIGEPSAYAVVDIGGGATNIAIISMNGLVISRRIPIAGNRFNEEIIRFVRNEFKLVIGQPTAEDIKIAIGSAMPVAEKLEITARGQDVATGLPKEVLIKDAYLRLALVKPLKDLVDAIREVIESTPPELVGDIYKNGVYLCGGSSLLRNIEELVQKDLAVNVKVVDDPLACVVRGTGMIAENLEKFRDILQSLPETRVK